MLEPSEKNKNMESIVSNLQDFVVNDLLYASDVGSVEPADELLTTGVLDSLASAQLMVHVEEEWQIKLEPTDLTLENFNTIASLAALVVRHTES